MLDSSLNKLADCKCIPDQANGRKI